MRDRPGNRLPLIATIGGFVAFGGDIVDLRRDDGPFSKSKGRPGPHEHLRARTAGAVVGDVEDTWLPLKNGPTWTLWDERATAPRLDPLRADVDVQRRGWEAAETTRSTWARRAEAARAASRADPLP